MMENTNEIKPTLINGRPYYTVKQTASLLNKHPNTIRYWMRNRRLAYIQHGAAAKSPLFIPGSEVERIGKPELV